MPLSGLTPNHEKWIFSTTFGFRHVVWRNSNHRNADSDTHNSLVGKINMEYKNNEFGGSFLSFVNSTLLSDGWAGHRRTLASPQAAVDACEESLRVAGETRASLNDVEERCLKNKYEIDE